jgi:TRAP-type C4-dicarboxylate transport system substrate-binding protein
VRKKSLFFGAIVFGIIGGFVLMTTVPPVDAASGKEKIVWTFAQLAHGKWCDNKLYGEWLPKRMAEATQGRLELHVPVGLMPAAEILAAVRDGAIQGAVSGTPYYSGEWPLGSFHAIPGILQANDEFPAVSNAVVWPYWDKSLRQKYNIRLAGMSHWPGIRLYTKKPIHTLADFKGVKIRGMGYYDSLAIEKTGARGVSIPWDEAFLAVQRGVVDGLVTGLVVYESMGYAEYCKYAHNWPVHGASAAAFIFMNGKAFEALPKDLQPIVQKVLKEAGDSNMACNIGKVDDSVKTLKAKGIQFLEAPAEDFKKCVEMLKPVRQAWLDQCKKAGSPEAEEMLGKVEAFLAQYRAKKGK